MKHVLAIRRLAFEDLGTFERMFVEWGYRVEYVDAPTRDPTCLPRTGSLLGGPIGTYEQDNYPFLVAELALIKQRLELNRALLGICLCAQMIARASGARVFAGPTKEIGWGPVALTDAGAQSALASLAQGAFVLHWHGDTFDLPTGAVCLSSIAAYTQQAFSIDTQLLDLQFHLEV
jgi:GMP synthase (glutamine-hydrolysing)